MLLMHSCSPPAASTCTCSRARIRSPAATSSPTSAPRVRRSKARSPAASCTRTLISIPARSATIPATYMPFPVTKEVLERGRERYNIYCAPCHSRVGDGNGFVPSRGFSRKPPSFHIARLQKAPARIFLRRDHRRLRHHARLRLADSAAGPLEHRGLHPRAAVEPERDHGRRARRAEDSVRAAEVPRAGYGRNVCRS